MMLLRDGWFVAVVPIARQDEMLLVYNVRGDVILQGVGVDRWRPNHDTGDEDHGPNPDLQPFIEREKVWR